MKGVVRLEKKGKLSIRFISPFEILEKYDDVLYRLALPQCLLVVHPVLHISLLKRCHTDDAYIIQWIFFILDHDLSLKREPISILHRPTRKMRSKNIDLVNV